MLGESRLAGLRELVRTNGEIKNIDSGCSKRGVFEKLMEPVMAEWPVPAGR